MGPIALTLMGSVSIWVFMVGVVRELWGAVRTRNLTMLSNLCSCLVPLTRVRLVARVRWTEMSGKEGVAPC